MKLFDEKKVAIVAGKFHPFTGPVKTPEGELKIADGQVMSDKELWGMTWYVDGVLGKVPP